VWEDALSWCNSQFFCRQRSGRNLLTFSNSHGKTTVVCGIQCLAYPNEFFVNNPLYFKVNNEHALDFALHLPRLLGLLEFGLSVYGWCSLPPYACLIIAKVVCTYSEICTKFYAAPLSDQWRNLIRPETWLQKERDAKISTSTQLCETLTPNIC
jgi:hypothetical protein